MATPSNTSPSNTLVTGFSIGTDLHNNLHAHLANQSYKGSLSSWICKAIRNEIRRETRLDALEFITSLTKKEQQAILSELKKATL
jgi:hypothetical protein